MSSNTTLVSARPAVVGPWIIKGSEMSGSICLVVFNLETEQTLVRFFKKREDAQTFMGRVVLMIE